VRLYEPKTIRAAPAQPVDRMLLDDMELEGGQPLSVEHRRQIRGMLDWYHNRLPKLQAEYRQLHGRRSVVGRPTTANRDALVTALLMIFEDAGGTVRTCRGQRNLAAAFLRAAWPALQNPRIKQAGFGRLAARVWSEPRRRADQARESALRELRDAWKK
jgi:hypothetical protein